MARKGKSRLFSSILSKVDDKGNDDNQDGDQLGAGYSQLSSAGESTAVEDRHPQRGDDDDSTVGSNSLFGNNKNNNAGTQRYQNVQQTSFTDQGNGKNTTAAQFMPMVETVDTSSSSNGDEFDDDPFMASKQQQQSRYGASSNTARETTGGASYRGRPTSPISSNHNPNPRNYRTGIEEGEASGDSSVDGMDAFHSNPATRDKIRNAEEELLFSPPQTSLLDIMNGEENKLPSLDENPSFGEDDDGLNDEVLQLASSEEKLSRELSGISPEKINLAEERPPMPSEAPPPPPGQGEGEMTTPKRKKSSSSSSKKRRSRRPRSKDDGSASIGSTDNDDYPTTARMDQNKTEPRANKKRAAAAATMLSASEPSNLHQQGSFADEKNLADDRSRHSFSGPELAQVIEYDKDKAPVPTQGDPMDDDASYSRTDNFLGGKKGEGFNLNNSANNESNANDKQPKQKEADNASAPVTEASYLSGKEDDVSTLGDPMNSANQHPQYRMPPPPPPEPKSAESKKSKKSKKSKASSKKKKKKKAAAAAAAAANENGEPQQQAPDSAGAAAGFAAAGTVGGIAAANNQGQQGDPQQYGDESSFGFSDPFNSKSARYSGNNGPEENGNVTYRSGPDTTSAEDPASFIEGQPQEESTSYTDLFDKFEENPEQALMRDVDYGSDDVDREDEKQPRRKTCGFILCICCCCIILAIIAGVVLAGLFLPDDGDDAPQEVLARDANTSISPTPAPSGNDIFSVSDTPAPTSAPVTAVPTVTPIVEDQELFDLIAASSSDNGAAILQSGTPQQDAFVWLQNSDMLRLPTNDGSNTTDQRRHLELSDKRILQRYSMAVFYFSTNGPTTWTRNDKWLSVNETECKWYVDTASGTNCDDDDVVTTLQFLDNDISGELPPEIGMLSGLRVLVIDNTAKMDVEDAPRMSGGIPDECSSLTAMDFFMVAGHNFTKGLADSIFSTWGSVTNIDLSRNNMPGTIPTMLSSLRTVISFNLAYNELEGPIPDEISGLRSVFQLNVRFNQLSGPVPDSIAQLDNVIALYLNNNNFTGSFPDISGMNSLRAGLDLSNNGFSGEIPENIFASTPDLRILRLSNNSFSGPLPNIGLLAEPIKDLYLEGNDFSEGLIPDDVCASIERRGGKGFVDCPNITCACCVGC